MVCLSPNDSFSAFDKQKLIRLAEFYPCDFSEVEFVTLDFELDTYVTDVKSDDRFSELKSISDLAQKLVETKKGFCISFGIYAFKIMLDSTYCYCFCGKIIFCDEYSKK